MKKIDKKSMDIVGQNIKNLKKIFPEVFNEGKIDFEKLENELGIFKDDKNEKYDFTWAGKSEAKKIALTQSSGTLRPCKEESKNWDKTQNLYIEGDNLEVLKLLQKSYHKKVKMIYIDPPYNTGKDFIYKDNFKDNIKNYLEITNQVDSEGNRLSTNSETNGRYHSNWLNMMYPRLKLARNLLKDDGVIFISIDDNEVANLRKLCDEIFGEDNFIANICHKNRDGVSNDKIISNNHNHILFYTKNYSLIHSNRNNYGILRNEQDFKNYNKNDNDGKGEYALNPVTGPGGASKGNPFYEILGVSNYWRFSKDRMLKMIDEKIVIKINNSLYQKTYKKDMIGKKKGATTWWDYVGTTANGTSNIKDLFENAIFDFSKPVSLIEHIMGYIDMLKNDLILDFFSGSATTAHAVMKLNSEDGGNRKFICVQLPEITDEKSEAFKAGYKNICEIGKERIRRAGELINKEFKQDLIKSSEELDIGFKVFKLDSSNIKSWDSDCEDLEQNLLESIENIKSDRNSEDLLYEIILKYGFDLTVKVREQNIDDVKIYIIDNGLLICCLEDEIDIKIVEKIAQFKEQFEKDNVKVIFKDSSFKNSIVKTNAMQILKQHGISEVISI